jgi:hypothetical protein
MSSKAFLKIYTAAKSQNLGGKSLKGVRSTCVFHSQSPYLEMLEYREPTAFQKKLGTDVITQ